MTAWTYYSNQVRIVGFVGFNSTEVRLRYPHVVCVVSAILCRQHDVFFGEDQFLGPKTRTPRFRLQRITPRLIFGRSARS